VARRTRSDRHSARTHSAMEIGPVAHRTLTRIKNSTAVEATAYFGARTAVMARPSIEGGFSILAMSSSLAIMPNSTSRPRSW